MENNFDEEKTKEFMQSFIVNNYRISNAESKELDKSGTVRFMLNNNIGVIENGCLVRTWGVQTDITDRKKTEKELVEKAIANQPDIIIINSALSGKHDIVQTLRFEKGLENVLFVVYQ